MSDFVTIPLDKLTENIEIWQCRNCKAIAINSRKIPHTDDCLALHKTISGVIVDPNEIINFLKNK